MIPLPFLSLLNRRREKDLKMQENLGTPVADAPGGPSALTPHGVSAPVPGAATSGAVQHTPGTWELDRHGLITAGDWHSHAPKGRIVCQLYGHATTAAAESWANGRLIAAAPDLLAALKKLTAVPVVTSAYLSEVVECAYCSAEVDTSNDGYRLEHTPDCEWVKARAAIARAEGAAQETSGNGTR